MARRENGAEVHVVTDALWQLDNITTLGRLAEVTVTLHPGITAVIGPSGAGKTTLLNLLIAFERPERGRITSQMEQGGHRLPLFWSPADGGLWSHLSVREHLQYVCPDSSRIETLLADFDLTARADAKPDALSQGERARLTVTRALAADAAVLVMDEPLAHVDPSRLDTYWQKLRDHLGDTSLVFATHDPRRVLAEAAQVICMAAGRVEYAGDVQTLYHYPPTQPLAAALGDANWLPPEAVADWLGESTDVPRCIRPHEVTLEPCDEGACTVEASRFEGTATRTTLRRGNAVRQWLHRPGAALASGMRVRIVVMLLLAFMVGCDDGRDPQLTASHLAVWNVPNDGPRIPAPRSATIMDDGRAIVIDTGGRVMIYSAEGKVTTQWRMPINENGNAEGTCIMRDGRIAVADTHYHRVVFFTMDGELESMFGERGREPGQFIYPVSVAEDREGHLFVCEYGGNDRVQKFAPDGTPLLSFGRQGDKPGEFQRASGMVIVDDEIFVADAMNNRVQVFDLQGKLLRILGRVTDLTLHYPYDVEASPDGSLFIVEYGAGRVSKVSRAGTLLGRFGSTGSASNQFATPWGIGIGKSGRLLVADTGNRRLVEIMF